MKEHEFQDFIVKFDSLVKKYGFKEVQGITKSTPETKEVSKIEVIKEYGLNLISTLTYEKYFCIYKDTEYVLFFDFDYINGMSGNDIIYGIEYLEEVENNFLK